MSFIRFVVWFIIGFVIGIAAISAAEAQEPEQFKAFPGDYGAICMPDAQRYLELNEYKEVQFWINGDGTHKWSLYENKESWFLAMHNAVNQITCFFDKGDVAQEG